MRAVLILSLALGFLSINAYAMPKGKGKGMGNGSELWCCMVDGKEATMTGKGGKERKMCLRSDGEPKATKKSEHKINKCKEMSGAWQKKEKKMKK